MILKTSDDLLSFLLGMGIKMKICLLVRGFREEISELWNYWHFCVQVLEGSDGLVLQTLGDSENPPLLDLFSQVGI